MATKNLLLFKNYIQISKVGANVSCVASRCISNDACKTPPPKDTKIHTGQVWADDDYRLVRFVDKPKHVNTQWAIDLIEKTPPISAESRVVSCDGGGGPTGHPKVYINLDKPGKHSCGYCGLRFYKDDHHH